MSNTISSNHKVVLEPQKTLINQIEFTFSKIARIEENIVGSNADKLVVYFTPDFSDINESIAVKIALINEIIEYIESQNIKSPDNYHHIKNKISAQLAYVTGRVDKTLQEISHLSGVENFTNKDIEMRDGIYGAKKEVLNKLNYIYDSFQKIRDEIINSEISELEYIKRFKEESNLIQKSFETKIDELTYEYENKFKNFDLRYEKISKSNELLNAGVDSGLKSLNQLNERTQKIELEFTSIIKKAEESAEFELSLAISSLEQKIETAISAAHEKSEEIEVLHSNFKSMVEKAGIYDLTNNYKVKAEKEEEEYKKFRKFTAWSIIAAIVSTLLIFIFAFFEPHLTDNNNQTNFLLLVSRLSISIMFFVLALYLSKQASKHYECYQENHRTFLQLAALEPFMANMTPEEKQEIRKGLIPSYFNQSTDGKFAAKGDEVDIPTNIHAMINRVFDLVAEKKETKPAETPAAEPKP